MDAIILYLPSPKERNKLYGNFDNELCAKAFKVIHDKQKGPLVFLRIYNGMLKKGQRIYNVQQNQSEQIARLYMAYADDFKEVEVVNNGNVAVAALKVRSSWVSFFLPYYCYVFFSFRKPIPAIWCLRRQRRFGKLNRI